MSRTNNGRWLRLLVVPMLASCIALGCSGGSDGKDRPNSHFSTTTTKPPTSDAIGRATQVPKLDLTIALPPTFTVAENPSLALLARSTSPRAVLSLTSETSSVVNHQAEGGESVEQGVLEGRSAAIVTNAQVDGLPAGIVANELLVDNGGNSFSLIFSSDPATLAAEWKPLIHSIRFSN